MRMPPAMMAAMIGELEDGAADQPIIPPAMKARRLLDHYAQLNAGHVFKVGDLAQLKPGFGTEYKHPRPGVPVIVTELLDPPYIDHERGSGSPQCQIKHDVRIGFLDDNDGGFMQFLFPSFLLEPYSGEIEAG